VGAPTANKGAVISFTGEPPTLHDEVVIDSPGAGLAMTLGDVMPGSGTDNGLELLIATQTKIIIARNGNLLAYVPVEANIDPTALPGPAISLAVETRPLAPNGTTRAWWYGVPSLNIVHRCIGSYCFDSNPVDAPNAAFGAAMGISGSTLVIGAPAYDGGTQGAVSIVDLDDFDAGFTGEDQNCTHGVGCCTAAHQLGICVGGAFCAVTLGMETSLKCLPEDAGTTVDAGTDGGTKVDSDAGIDGGTDGGGVTGPEIPDPAQFATCGCTSANGGFAVLLLAALALRRRAR
jgi:hypothetical protein